MHLQIDISFKQLVDVVKTLPTSQLKQLKAVIEKEENIGSPKVNLEKLLLDGPTATEDELKTIRNNRKAINQWRQTL
ncbi:MAG: hypothetical protein ABIN80_04385 [Dyadobacter sp.]|uniref:hypothetical protein n=1 Tax=Dyadobacter sp. TaxID=1914288 RepID=UPI003265C16F